MPSSTSTRLTDPESLPDQGLAVAAAAASPPLSPPPSPPRRHWQRRRPRRRRQRRRPWRLRLRNRRWRRCRHVRPHPPPPTLRPRNRGRRHRQRGRPRRTAVGGDSVGGRGTSASAIAVGVAAVLLGPLCRSGSVNLLTLIVQRVAYDKTYIAASCMTRSALKTAPRAGRLPPEPQTQDSSGPRFHSRLAQSPSQLDAPAVKSKPC